MKLYELASQYEELVKLAETSEDEADIAIFSDTLEGLEGEIEQKIENCAAVCKSIAAEKEGIDAERDRLSKRAKSLDGSIDRLKSYMQSAMEVAGLEKIKGKLFTVAIQDNPPRVCVDSEEQLSQDFKRIKWEIDKAKISTTLKENGTVTGAHLEYTRSLRIR